MTTPITDLSSLKDVNVNDAADGATGPFEPLPKGKYVCVIESAEIKPTNAGDGAYVKLQLRVAQESYNNRVLFDMIMVQHPTEKTVEIGIAKLSQLMLACGFDSIQPNPNAMMGKSVTADVGIQKAREHNGKQYEASNKIWAYEEGTATASTGGLPAEDLPFMYPDFTMCC